MENKKTVIQKLLDHENLDYKELESLIFDHDDIHFETIIGENRRWSRAITKVFKINDRYFMVDYDEGLTEYQENEYYDQPTEVALIQEQVIKTVNKYTSI